MAVDQKFPLNVDLEQGQQNSPPIIVMPEPDPYISSTEDQPNPSPFLAQPDVPRRPLMLSFHPLLDPPSPQMHPISAMANSVKRGSVHLRLKPSRPLILGRKHKGNLPLQPERGGYKAVSRRHAIIWIEDGDKVRCVRVISVYLPWIDAVMPRYTLRTRRVLMAHISTETD